MSFEDRYGNNKLDQPQWPVRAEWVQLRMKTRGKDPIGLHSAVNSAFGTQD